MEGSVSRIRFQIIDGDDRSRKVILQHFNVSQGILDALGTACRSHTRKSLLKIRNTAIEHVGTNSRLTRKYMRSDAKYAERTLARVIRQYPSTLKLKVVE